MSRPEPFIVDAIELEGPPKAVPFTPSISLWGLVTVSVPKVIGMVQTLLKLAELFTLSVKPNGDVFLRHTSGSIVQFSANGDVRVFAARDWDAKAKRFYLMNSNAKRLHHTYRRKRK